MNAAPQMMLVGRILLATVFLVAGIRKLMAIAGTTAYMTKLGFPMPEVMVWVGWPAFSMSSSCKAGLRWSTSGCRCGTAASASASASTSGCAPRDTPRAAASCSMTWPSSK